MKRLYIEPKAWILNIEDESALCAATLKGIGGQITDPDYEDIVDNPIGGGGNEDVPITAKGGDFFEESISPRSLWGDDEE